MSFEYYCGGMYGVVIKSFVSPEIITQMDQVYDAAYNNTLDEVSVPGLNSILEKYPDRNWEGYPGELCQLVFESTLSKAIPGFSKMKRIGHIAKIDSDANSGDACEAGDLLFGIGIYAFPLKKGSHGPPTEFREVANMMLWVTGG